MRNLILLFVVMLSCTHIEKNLEKDNATYFIDTLLNSEVSVKEVKSILKEPNEIEKSRFSETILIYRYEDKSTKFLKWNFGINDNGMVEWIIYLPSSNPLLDRVEILPTTLKRYNCEKKVEIDEADDGHYIDEITFFECADGRIRAYYNMHGEISNILVSRKIN